MVLIEEMYECVCFCLCACTWAGALKATHVQASLCAIACVTNVTTVPEGNLMIINKL